MNESHDPGGGGGGGTMSDTRSVRTNDAAQ